MDRTIVHTATPQNVKEKPIDRHIEAIIALLREYPQYNYKFTIETRILMEKVNYCPVCQTELNVTRSEQYTDFHCPKCGWDGRLS